MAERVRAGRTVGGLALEFAVSEHVKSCTLVRQDERDAERCEDELSSTKREELPRLRQENNQLRLERDILKRAAAWFARDSNAVPERSSGSGRRTRPCFRSGRNAGCWAPSPAAMTCGEPPTLGAGPERCRREGAGTGPPHPLPGAYGGVPRVHAELATQSARLGRKPIARLMRASGLGGVSRRQAFHTTVRDRNLRPAAKLVEHEFTAPAPGRPSVADISSIPSCVLRSQ